MFLSSYSVVQKDYIDGAPYEALFPYSDSIIILIVVLKHNIPNLHIYVMDCMQPIVHVSIKFNHKGQSGPSYSSQHLYTCIIYICMIMFVCVCMHVKPSQAIMGGWYSGKKEKKKKKNFQNVTRNK